MEGNEMEQGMQAMGLLIPAIFGLVYLGFLGFFVWVAVSMVSSLRAMANAQTAAAAALRRVADGLERRA